MAKSRVVAPPTPGILKQEIEFPRTTPEPSAATLEDRLSFWEQVHAVPDDEWWSGMAGDKGYKVYLYRAERKGYIEIVHEDFDEEWVKQRYGGGEYRAQLNDVNGRTVASERFFIVGLPRPEPGAQSSAPQAPPATNGFEGQVLEMMRESNRRNEAMMERMLARLENISSHAPAQPSAADTATLAVLPVVVKGIVDVFSNSMPQKTDPMELLKLMQSMQPRQPDILELLIKAKSAGLIPEATAGGSLMQQLEQLGKVAESLGWTAGGGKGIGELLIEKGPAILEQMGKVVGNYRDVEAQRTETARAISAAQRPQPPAAAATVQPQILPSSPNGAPATANGEAAASALELEPVGTPAPAATDLGPPPVDPNFVKTKIVHAIAQGMTGGDILAFLDVMDPQFVNSLEGVSAGDIEAWCSSDPILRNAIALPRFQQCVKEIVADLRGDGGELVN